MTDPKRWTDDPSVTDHERSLLMAADGQRMPDLQKNELWSAIALRTLPAGTGHGATSEASAGATTASGSLVNVPLVKGLCLLAVLTGLTLGGYHVMVGAREAKIRTQSQRTELVTTDESEVASPPASQAPLVTSNSKDESLPTQDVSARSGPAPHPSPSAIEPRESQLRAESRAVLEIRQALRSGDTSNALRLLDQAKQRFRPGALAEEREALAIEALSKSGARAAATQRAAAFLRVYPRSPHAADVQRYLSP